jgi:hypothetical protein
MKKTDIAFIVLLTELKEFICMQILSQNLYSLYTVLKHWSERKRARQYHFVTLLSKR